MLSKNDGFYHEWVSALCDRSRLGLGFDGVGEDSVHGTWDMVSRISFMACRIPF